MECAKLNADLCMQAVRKKDLIKENRNYQNLRMHQFLAMERVIPVQDYEHHEFVKIEGTCKNIPCRTPAALLEPICRVQPAKHYPHPESGDEP